MGWCWLLGHKWREIGTRQAKDSNEVKAIVYACMRCHEKDTVTTS